MNKLLNILKEIEAIHLSNYVSVGDVAKDEIKVLKQALKDSNEIKKELKLRIQQNGELVSQLAQNDKKVKALDITRNFIKSLGLTFLFCDNKKIIIVGKKYEKWYDCNSQEEYDFLKEVLE